MVKAKDFWEYLCNTLEYRFFAGVPCLEFKKLYNAMTSEIMHYIPAVNINTALGMASGVDVSGTKSGIIFHIRELYYLLNDYKKFNKIYEIPVLFIVYCDEEDLKLLVSNKIPYTIMRDNFETQLKRITNKMEKEKAPCALVIKEEIFE